MAGRGIVWERVCNNSRSKMQQDGLIHWMRMHPPILKIGPGKKGNKGSFLAVRTGKGPPDWIVLCNGLSILGDDKDSKACLCASKNARPKQVVYSLDNAKTILGSSCYNRSG